MCIAHRATRLFLAVILLSVLPPQTQAAPGRTLLLKAGNVAAKQVQANGTLLATFPASALSHVQLPEVSLDALLAHPVWDEGRGIYQTAIPGIGFSFCAQEGRLCLHNGTALMSSAVSYSMKNFAVRLYKIGEMQPGDYALPDLFTLSHHGTPLLTLGLNGLRLNVSQCTLTRENLRVRFPDATLSHSPVLSTVRFHLPVRCYRAEDYDNMAFHFVFKGKRIDAQHIETGLSGIGLSVRNEQGKFVDFSAAASDTGGVFHDTGYVAELSRDPGQPAQAGEFSVSITAEMTMR